MSGNITRWKPDAKWKLVNRTTGAELSVGSPVRTFDGQTVRILDVEPPHKPNSEGRVWCSTDDPYHPKRWYAGVIGAEYVMVE